MLNLTLYISMSKVGKEYFSLLINYDSPGEGGVPISGRWLIYDSQTMA
jgi:hypothetical protein